MPFFRRKKQGPSAPQSATSAVSSANSVPRSGFTFVDNSKGALEAIQEVSEKLDEALIELECQGQNKRPPSLHLGLTALQVH